MHARGRAIGLAAVLAGLLIPAQASGASVCHPTVGTGQFCVDYSLALSSMTAAAPFNVDATVMNTSPLAGGSQVNWLRSATVRVTDTGTTTPPTVTRSDQLANNLMLAGGTSCTAPAYSDCAGGSGTVVASAACCGTSNGAFGIEKIVNVNPPAAGNYAHYRVTIQGCVNFLGSCQPLPPTVQDLQIPEPAGGGSPQLAFTLVTQGTVATGVGNVDYSLTSFVIHLKGTSNLIDGGAPLAQPQTIFTLPRSCGPYTGTASFLAGDNVRTVSIPQSFTITGCPTAAVTGSATNLTASLDGSASTAGTGGRTIAKWHWLFGDGSAEQVTTGPTVTHDYATGGTQTVTLTVEDSAGALSAPVTTQVVTTAPAGGGGDGGGDGGGNPAGGTKTPTTTGVSAKAKRKKIKVRGSVAPADATGAVGVELLKKVKRRGFVPVKEVDVNLAGGAFAAKFKNPKRAKKCEAEATYAGDAGHEASSSQIKFKC